MNEFLMAMALSLMVSDLNQTAQFTSKGGKELNPIARPFVEAKSSDGEVGLVMIGTGALIVSQRYNSKSLSILMIIGHGWGVIHNASLGWKDGIVVMPLIYTLRWS